VPGLITRIGERDRAEPPQPQQLVQLPVLLGPPGIRHGGVILGQELLVEPSRQPPKDLHRVVRVTVIDRQRRHTHHHRASQSGTGSRHLLAALLSAPTSELAAAPRSLPARAALPASLPQYTPEEARRARVLPGGGHSPHSSPEPCAQVRVLLGRRSKTFFELLRGSLSRVGC
jgi:hypothetical protein